MLKENIYGWGNQNLCCILEFLWGQDLNSRLSMKLFCWHHMVLKWNSLCYSHSWPSSFLIRWWFKACLYIRDLISSEPALPPGEHPGSDMAIIFSSVGGCHKLCWNVALCISASPSLSFCHYIYLLIFQWIKCAQALPWMFRSLLLSSTHPLWTHSELFFLKPLDKQNLSRGIILMGVN